MNIDPLYDFFTGRCIRTISCPEADPQAIYLTFDDGPHPTGTPQVLSLLDKHKIPATFFLIGEKAEAFPELAARILENGHAIADHTIDHNTDNYFKGPQMIGAWLDQSAAKLRKLGLSSVGFRSPLGIKTPALNMALRQRKEPLILWNVRFYDTNHLLTVERVEKKMSSVIPGSIILLHDTHEGEKLRIFLEALDRFIVLCKEKGLHFSPLKRDLITGSYRKKYEIHE
jgi:peptidoglycan/xylan/chitin deacetylase (PgdA/CDA1 family)